MFAYFNCKRALITLSFALFISSYSFGQDAYFTQYLTSPMTLNPALAGTAPGSFRVSANYRDQWRSALENPYKTFAASGDLSFNLGGDKGNPDIAGLGFLFFSDRVGLYDLNTSQVALAGSFHKSLSDKSKKYIGAGISFGILQKSINYEHLTFQDEFNATDGFTLPTGEVLPQNNLAVGDFTLGLSYFGEGKNGFQYFIGGSYTHINAPNISFYKHETTSDPNLVKENVLDSKLSVHAGVAFKSSYSLTLQPRAMLNIQGSHMNMIGGVDFKYKLDDRGSKFFHVGPWIRTAKGINGVGLESSILSVGYEQSGFILGVSYDHSVQHITSSRAGLNAFEVSVTYIGDYENETNFCPTF